MRTVTVIYHFEDGAWWAESTELPGFVAGAETFDETRNRVREGLEFDLGEPVEVDERFDNDALRERRQVTLTHNLGPIIALATTTSRSATNSRSHSDLQRPPAEFVLTADQ
jgi:predicted RNase H-like HicB family nuclease